MSDAYQASLHRAWVGELRGEVFFATLAQLTADSEMKRKWTVLAELERRVGLALEPIVELPESEAVETDSAAAAAREFAAEPLAEGLASIAGVIDGAVEAYNTLREAGPEAHAAELEILARHEIALQTFVRREVALQAKDSLEEVEGLLEELRSGGVS